MAPPVTLTPSLGVVQASILEQRASASANFLRRMKPEAWLRRAPQIISTEASSAPGKGEVHGNVWHAGLNMLLSSCWLHNVVSGWGKIMH